MTLNRMKRVGAWAGLAAAMAFAVPAVPASAATHGQPTALTITPQLAARHEAKLMAETEASEGLIQLAQNNNVIRPNQAQRQRQAQRNQAQRQRQANRNQNQRQRQVNVNQNQRQRQANRNQNQRQRTANRNQAYRDRVYYNGRWWRYNGGRYYDDNGAWVAAGVIGLAAGAIAGAAIASQPQTVVVEQPSYYPAPFTSEWYRQCGLKYRSFRSSDGTFLGYDGVRRQCVLP
ncbi:BA14K family protein [Acuticoccus kandeliae]|uniref:BA14K family protein n=1 Tax=Acuticoccus kandeliae TaxID=2073160 RepID=UPI001300837E|nr:BA14K family protein [Acuticoccus kandeliae]